jgi:glycogen debranching enzyme
MAAIPLPLNSEGTTEPGVIRVTSLSTTIHIVISVGTKFHSPTTFIATTHPTASGDRQDLQPIRAYSILEDLIYQLQIITPGVFSLTATMGDSITAQPVIFVVDPVIEINGKPRNFSSLSIQTNFARCIGHLKDWIPNLTPISELGYDIIHLPPFQELGGKSQYAISDHFQISADLFPSDFPATQRWPLFKTTVQRLNQQLGLLIMTDIVLTHVSLKATFLADHPDAGYSVANTPHLAPALYLDDFLATISDQIASSKFANIGPKLTSDSLVQLENALTRAIWQSEFPKFYLIDVENSVKELAEFEGQLTKTFNMLRMRALRISQPQRVNILRERGVKGNKIDVHYAAALFKTTGVNDALEMDAYQAALGAINAPFLQHLSTVIQEIVKNTIKSASHRFVDDDGLKLGAVSAKTPLVESYFAKIATKSGVIRLVCDGYVPESAPGFDFLAPECDAVLKRELVVWNDTIRLRYGTGAEDSPFLWNYMTKYVESVAEVVAAIRLGGTDNTPIHVSDFFIQKARAINPKIYVMGALDLNTKSQAIQFIQRLGITSILREGCHQLTARDITALLWASGGRSVATLAHLDRRAVLRPSQQIPAVVFDMTHDNQFLAFDRVLAIAAIAMACSPIGSTRGFDDHLPFNPSVVEEFRPYSLSPNAPALQRIRKIFNFLHREMSGDEMEEILANYYGNVISLFRSNSETGRGVWLVARFPGESTVDAVGCPSAIESLVVEARLNGVQPANGLNPSRCDLFLNTELAKLSSCQVEGSTLRLSNFPVGSIAVFRTQAAADFATLEIPQLLYEFGARVSNLNLSGLNVLLFRAEPEEQAALGRGTYGFPDDNKCFYAGLQGVISQFDRAPDMASPVFANLRDGDWLFETILNRLLQIPALVSIESYLNRLLGILQRLPRFLIPKFTDQILRSLYRSARAKVISLMSDFLKDGDDFVQDLAVSSVSFCGPPALLQGRLKQLVKLSSDSSLAAGLPFFCTGLMRGWGRDTFISLRGIFLVTGRFADARDHLVAYAAVLYNGLIPNLHNGGNNCRYNSRDATWWFLQALQDYAAMSGEDPFAITVLDRTMADVVQEIMQRHAEGIHFREPNAGSQLDAVMSPGGFDVDVVTDWSNGFVIGGNEWNCGTWMDKMVAGGVPATPRDGAAVEIVGLLASALRFLGDSFENGSYRYEGVNASEGFTRWRDWANLVIRSFEGWFYIPKKREQDSQYFIEQSLVGIRGIYKDTVGASNEFGDYQFRPNLLVAMTVAPELFDPQHATACLDLVEQRLLGGIGMRTLDETDWRYRGTYDTSESGDTLASGGFNYHNGPEWVWLTGFFFRASMRFRRKVSERMLQTLAALKRTLKESVAFGLPELTNRDGEPCINSCTTQAWSVATVLDMLFDYSLYTEQDPIDWQAEEEDLPE